jgi:hypothetical protein
MRAPLAPGLLITEWVRQPVTEGAGGVSAITSALKRMKTKTGGQTRDVTHYESGATGDEWSLEPGWRQRLDHYGNNGDGWDSDGWERDYAGPLQKEAQAWLDREFGAGRLKIHEIGEKGHVYVVLTDAGKRWLAT